tara:strand:- start:1400 stop:1588 length:189 start_codon:yes stop_codon:yes gene_type:complete
MNTNKQQTKGNKMRKIAMVIGILSVLATSANAGYWTHTPNIFGGGYTSKYTPTYNSLMGGWY